MFELVHVSAKLGRDKPFTYDVNIQCCIYEVTDDEYEQVKDWVQTEAQMRHASERAIKLIEAEKQRRETIRRDAIAFLRAILDDTPGAHR